MVFQRTLIGIVILMLSISTGCGKKSTEPDSSGETDLEKRYEVLTHGFNWDRMRTALNPPHVTEMRTLKQQGFKHIRLVVGVNQLFDENSPAVIDQSALTSVRSAIQSAHSAGLAVVVDMHDAENDLWDDAAYGDMFASFWSSLAMQLKSFDPEKTFFESVNEPSAQNAADWQANQRKIVQAIRLAAPDHSVLADANLRVTPNNWDQIGGLVELPVFDDPYVIYTFHFYEPMDFTHQGAAWGAEHWQHLVAVPYPSTPENVANAISRSDPSVKGTLEYYGKARWNAEKIMSRFAVAGAWAEANEAFVYCGELGCINWTDAPAGSREAWYRDVKAAVNHYNMGWAVWFSVDEEVEAGLGL